VGVSAVHCSPGTEWQKTENRLVGKYTIVPATGGAAGKNSRKSPASVHVSRITPAASSITECADRQADMRQGGTLLLTFLMPVSSVKEDKVDRELHSDGMHGLTGEYPQTFTRTQAFAPQQAFGALCAMIGNFHAAGQLGMARSVQNLKANLRAGLRAPCAPSVQRHGKPGRQLHLVPMAPLKMLRQPGIIRVRPQRRGAAPQRSGE